MRRTATRAEAEAEKAALRRAAVFVAIGCVAILLGGGILLEEPVLAVAGCLVWIVAMVVSYQRDRPAGRRR